MTSNSYGDYKTTRRRDWAAFDQLPAQLRFAVNYAAQPYASRPILDAFIAGMPARAIIRNLRESDLDDTAQVYGASHPEARRR